MGVEECEGNNKVLYGTSVPQNSRKPASYYDESYGKFAGLTTYDYLQDADQQSTISDDTASVVSSVFDLLDTQSIVSSQSSEGSAGSDSSDDGSDGENTSPSRARQTSTTRKTFGEHQIELLSGLHPETLPYRPATHQSNAHTIVPDSRQPVASSCESRTGQPIQAQHSALSTRRRSIGQESAIIPPRLKRDTESSDCFVMLLICKSPIHSTSFTYLTTPSAFATRLITAIWPLSACPPMMSSSFNGAGVLPLEVFIHETLRRSKTSYSTLQVALWYLVMLKCHLPQTDFTKEQRSSDCRAMQCGRRMFLAALMLASKYLQDRNYSTRAWSKISGLRICEINENEMKYLQAINYSLHVKKDVFENWSRLVIQLSKLSKLKPGCSGLDFRGNDLPGNGHQNALNAMIDDSPAAGPNTFSCQWWSGVLAKLNPAICHDADSTGDFLDENVPQAFRTDVKMDMSALVTADSSFGDRSSNGSQSGVSTPVQSAQSPAGVATTLPLKPVPRNLPTPMSTPRVSEGSLLSLTSQSNPQNLRCAASFDALRSVRKQCLANANLERCPPPRPQSYHTSSRSLTRPAASSQFNPCFTSSTLSPMTSSSHSRSRSSSTSSNSSWTSAQTTEGTTSSLDKLVQHKAQDPSPLTRVVSMPESRVPHCLPKLEHSLRRKPQISDIATAHALAASNKPGPTFHTFSGTSTSRSDLSENETAQTLLQMAYGPDETRRKLLKDVFQQSPNSVCGHKRSISCTSERNQANIRSSSQTPTPMDYANYGTQPNMDFDETDKAWQMPTAPWAMPKKPMPRPFDHKRMAIYCAEQHQVEESPASRYAALQLKDQLISA